MFRSALSTCILLLSLVGLLGLAMGERKAEADLFCWDLQRCSGQAGCPSGGDQGECHIFCKNGGMVACILVRPADPVTDNGT